MGNQNAKPQDQNNKNNVQADKNNKPGNSLKGSKVKDHKKQSRSNSPRDLNNDSKLRNSPDMSFKNMGNNSAMSKGMTENHNPSRFSQQLNNESKISVGAKSNHYNQKDIQLYDEKNKKDFVDEDQDNNQFMPLMKLPSSGEIQLKITLIQLNVVSTPKPHIKKKIASYNSVMNWKKNSNNIFNFIIKEDQNYELTIDVDMQGNTLNKKDQFWCALCPINIPFGQTVKVGQMTCVNWYQKLQEDEDDDENQLGPSAKNLDFKINEDIFDKWGEKVPESFYAQDKNENTNQAYKKQPKPTKFVPYKQLSRYFDTRNIWKATTFYEQTLKTFRSWVIQVLDRNIVPSISKQLHIDLKNRQLVYTKTIYQSLFE